MNDPIVIWSYVLFFSGTFAMVAVLMRLNRRPKRNDKHPAAGE